MGFGGVCLRARCPAGILGRIGMVTGWSGWLDLVGGGAGWSCGLESWVGVAGWSRGLESRAGVAGWSRGDRWLTCVRCLTTLVVMP